MPIEIAISLRSYICDHILDCISVYLCNSYIGHKGIVLELMIKTLQTKAVILDINVVHWLMDNPIVDLNINVLLQITRPKFCS